MVIEIFLLHVILIDGNLKGMIKYLNRTVRFSLRDAIDSFSGYFVSLELDSVVKVVLWVGISLVIFRTDSRSEGLLPTGKYKFFLVDGEDGLDGSLLLAYNQVNQR